MKHDFLHKMLNVAVLWSADKHHPVVRKTFHGGFLSDLGTMTEFQLHLNGTLKKSPNYNDVANYYFIKGKKCDLSVCVKNNRTNVTHHCRIISFWYVI